MNRIKLKQFLDSTTIFTVCLAICFPSHIFALDIQLQTRINIHTNQPNTSLKRELTLPAGTRVRIPNESYDNQLTPEQNLIDWIRYHSQLKTFTNSIGQQKQDYFSEVEIISTPDPSLSFLNGKKYQMALQYLVKKDENYEFYTRPNANIYSDSSTTKAQELNPPSNSSTEGDCSTCSLPNPEPMSPLQTLKNLTSDFLNDVNQKSELYTQTKNPLQIISNFQSTCKGVDFNAFKNHLKQKAEAEQIPLEVLLAIMTQESSGRCLPQDSNGNYGLFQINKKTSSNVSLCTDNQKRKIQIASLQELESNKNLNCLENPVINSNEAIRIYKEKYKSTNKSTMPDLKKWSDYSPIERDAIRRAISAYNGGQTHVNRASSDIQNFQKNYAPDLDTQSFELQRIFFFRNILKEQGHVSSFESARSNQNTIDNLAYTQSITGKEPNTDTCFIKSWEKVLL